MKAIQGIYKAPGMHWVGDGFPVRSLFSYSDHGRHLSPFLLLDHAGPAHFDPVDAPRGVGVHPHRGFETVTIIYQGEVDHRDSSGGGGHIGPGDVQWMTAASGVVHEEFHSPAFTKSGGTMEMVQLWVNLPAKDKMTAPRYQTLLNADIPTIELADGAGQLRVIAGQVEGHSGAANTFTQVNLWDIRLNADRRSGLPVPEGHTLGLVVLEGRIRVNDEEWVNASELVIHTREGQSISLEADRDSRVLLLGGEPIDEPVVGYGPFVMNTQQEISQAILDYNQGHFGSLPNEAAALSNH